MATSMVHWNGDQAVAVDLETTGTDPLYHEIWEICILPLDSNFVPRRDVTAFHLEMKPQHPERVMPTAINVNRDGYFKACTRGYDSESAKDLLESWVDKLGLPYTNAGVRKRLIPVGQNVAAFDVPFLKRWLEIDVYETIFSHAIRDTMILALALNDVCGFRVEQIPYPKYNLRYLANKLNVPYDKAHHAMNDCLATAGVYRALIRQMVTV